MTVQTTLAGDRDAPARIPPATMVFCDECGESVLRSRRGDHRHDLQNPKTTREQRIEDTEQQLLSDVSLTTQTFVVEYRYEYIEKVTVEATCQSDARDAAERKQTYDGELIDTLHTTTRSVGSESAATIEYLEDWGILPDDHDVTQSDIEMLVNSGERQ